MLEPPHSRSALLIAVLASLLLGGFLWAPVLDAGFRDDDYVQRAMLDGRFTIERGALDLFWFAGRNRAENDRLRDAGYLPWWSAPDLRLSMLRPLASALTALDHRLIADSPRAQHAHSLFWWALLVVAAALSLSRTLPPLATAIACLAYAVEGAHLIPLSWLANRSTLIASSMALLALWLHISARERGTRTAAVLSPVFAMLALGGGEYALSVLAYVVAYEMVGRHEPLRVRARALLPIGAVCLAYLGLRAALGYGVADSGYYLRPFDPGFLPTAAPRAAVLSADVVFGLPSLWFNGGGHFSAFLASLPGVDAELVRRLPPSRTLQVGVGVVGVVVAAGLVRFVARVDPARGRAAAWLGLGALLAMLPVVGALPSDRVLAGAAFGMAGVVGCAIAAAVAALAQGPSLRRALALLLALACVTLHLALPIRNTRARAAGFARESGAFRLWARSAEIPKRGVEQLHVVVMSASDFTTAANLPWLRQQEGLGLPRSYRRLSGAWRPHALKRVTDDVLELTVLGAPLRGGGSTDALYRADSMPLSPGQVIALDGMRVEVVETDGGYPRRARFVFDESLDGSERYLFMQATPDGLHRFAPPRLGETRRFPIAWFPRLLDAGLARPPLRTP